MPCRDYMDDYQVTPSLEIRAKLDMLSRIACKALEHIEASADGLEVLILKDPEIADWWREHKKADEKAKKDALAKEEKLRIAKERNKMRETILAKLTPEERKFIKR